MTLKFTERVKLNSGNDLIMTYRGQIAGEDFFAYIKCEEKGVKLMRQDWETSTPRKLEEYGEVLYRDTVIDPDDKAKEFLQNYLAQNGGEMM
jgi:hypothetical protein